MSKYYKNNNKQYLRVILVNGDDPASSRASGTKSYVWDLSTHLVRQGINPTIIGIGKHNCDKYPFNFISVLNESKISSYKFLFALFIKCFFLKIPESAIIHTQRPDDLLPFVIFFKKNPKVCTLHGLSQKKIQFKKGRLIAKIYERIEIFTLRRADSIISVDDSTKEFYINKYPWIQEKLTVIPVGIDLTKFKPLNKPEMRKKYGFSVDDKIIMYVGRLEAEKNLDFLIDVFYRFNNNRYKLVLVGNGRDKTRLQEICFERGMQNVIFLGEFDHDKIPEILNCADLFVLASLFESGPLVVIEAIACNVPVVSTDVGRVREFLNNSEMGVICKMDKSDFIEAINFFLDKKELQRQNLNYIYKYSFEKTLNKTKEIYYALQNNS